MEEELAEIDQLIRKYAILNAVKYGGKAKVESVIGKVFSERPDLKLKVKDILKRASTIVREVNELALYEQKAILEENWPELLVVEKVPPKEVLPPLPNVKRYKEIVTRFPPNPDCVLHLGNTRSLVLSHEYARMYKGKFILRFEDTDPKTKKPKLEFYDAIREDMIWLGCEWDKEHRQSDRILIYYGYTETLLKDENAYVCTCDREVFRKLIMMRKACPCRSLPSDDQLDRWDKMIEGKFEEGKAIVRIKTDLSHPNPAVRDWPALRIIDVEAHPHPIVGDKYSVWPLYNLACGLDDHLLGVTHIIRGKEHIVNEMRQRFMYGHLGWMYPETVHFGRLKMEGVTLSKSKIKLGIERGEYTGYDDPRLPTLRALRRRGIQPEAIRKIMIELGPKPVDVTISWKNLYAHNKKAIDPVADRYFFVSDPIKLITSGIKKSYTARLPVHPDHPERGFREVEVRPIKGRVHFLLSGDDHKILKKDKVTRLMGLFNVKIIKVSKERVDAIFHSESLLDARKLKSPLLHWVAYGTGLNTEVVMPDGSRVRGICEDSCRTLQEGSMIQFERFGFVRIDRIDKQLVAYYTHS